MSSPESGEVPDVSVEALMEHAASQGASDIHVTVGLPPMVRVHGKLLPVPGRESLNPAATESVARAMTTEAQWAEFARTRELDFSVGYSKVARFRVNLFWQRGSVGIAMRAIPHSIPSLQQLGLPSVLEKFAMTDTGLFLVTGPTGSGKSTSLAAMVDYINRNRNCHIVTIEDPIEYLHSHRNSIVNQREMYHDTDSFAEALKHVLRQDPDVILIGEMRDLETIQTALTLAETGHLVLATLHTADTTQAISRIIDVYPPHQQPQARTQLSLVLVGIMAQMLLPTRDGSGRVAAFEVLSATPAIRHMIRSNELAQVYSSVQTGTADGMCTLNSCLLKLYRQGVITRDMALHKSPRVKELLEHLDGEAGGNAFRTIRR